MPLDAQFSETYVSSGIGKSGEDDEKSNIASFVRKTKELLLNEEVLKEVEVSAPGDQVSVVFQLLLDSENSNSFKIIQIK